MDYEELANISNTSFEDITPKMSSHLIIQEITFTIFCLIGILADIVIIYTILKFQRLRNVSNIFILNWAVADILSLIVTPSGYRIFSVIDNFSLPGKFICVIITVGSILHATVSMFAIAVCVNWAFESYFKKWHSFVVRYHKVVIALVWCGTIILCIIHGKDCAYPEIRYGCSECVLCSCLFILFFAVVILQISRAVSKWCKKPNENSPLKLNLVTAYITCWFFGLVPNLFIILHEFFAFITLCLVFSSAFTNLTLLYYYDPEFKSCLRQALKRTNNKYEESTLNLENSIVDSSNSRPEISFERKQNYLENA